MASDFTLSETGLPSYDEPIRIVPISSPSTEVVAAPTAQLVYNNGPLLTAVEVYTIFWGSQWQQAPESDLVQKLNAFFDYILTSPLLDQMAEYSTAKYKIGRGSRSGTTTLTTSDPGSSVTDDQIQQFINDAIAKSTLPQPTANTLYFVYLPSGTTVTLGSDGSCSSFCGYHNAINNKIYYAVMPYPDCSGCTNNLSTFDSLTSTSSHELCEAITDPIPGQGWYDQANGEIGDICAWQTRQEGNYTIQKEWSNSSNSCV